MFEFSYRYIDDLCLLNNPCITQFLKPSTLRSPSNPFWIYPLDIVYLQPEIEDHVPGHPALGTMGHFLNVHILILDPKTGIFDSTRFDKRRLLPFSFQQYIQFASNRPVWNSYNIVISQIVPILYMSNSAMLALTELHILVRTMVNNGFSKARLDRLILRFCSSQCFPGIRFPIIDLCRALEEILDLRALRYVHRRIESEHK